jgi:HK97 gp10 family phage protein
MPAGIVIKGLKETQAAMHEFPRLLVARAFVKALRAGIDVLAEELLARTPEREEGDRDEDLQHLKDAIVSEVILTDQLDGGTASVGFGKLGHIANWLEFGHRMVTHKPGLKEVGNVDPKPFMRPAFEAAAEQAMEAFGDVLQEELAGGL